MEPVSSIRIGDVWAGDSRATRGRVVLIDRISPYGASPFDPVLGIVVTDDSARPTDIGHRFYSRVSWLQAAYRPTGKAMSAPEVSR